MTKIYILFLRPLTLFLTAFFFALQVHAQKNDLGSWTIITVKSPKSGHWSGYGEFQMRSLSTYDRFYYYEIKGGLTYAFLEKYSATLGAGLYNTFEEGPEYDDYSKQKEFRIWQQFIAEQQLGVVELEHRYRIEQRFTDSYANRFRYRLNATLPLNKKKLEAGTVYTNVYDEVFFTDKVPNYARNRFQLGAGYCFTDALLVQIGWLRQVDYLAERLRKKNYLFTSFSFSIAK